MLRGKAHRCVSPRKPVYLEDEGFTIQTKTCYEKKKRPPKLNRRRPILDPTDAGLTFLSPKNPQPDTFKMYDKSRDLSYLEQCYNVVGRIGNGSYAHVYKVASKQDGKFYALKLTEAVFLGNKHKKLRVREVIFHSALSGRPNFITLHSAWVEDGLLYMLMELGKRCLAHRYEVMEEDECWEVLADMASALNLMHQNGFGHFDVKLENILEGFDGLYKLADFGLTVKFKKTLEQDPFGGSAQYLAPELLDPFPLFSEKADIFSLGISILELAGNLKLPSHGEVWAALRNDKFPCGPTRHVTDELCVLLKRMMARDPTERPTAQELLMMPKIRVVMRKRRRLYPKTLRYPRDPLRLFMLVSVTCYAVVTKAVQQLLKKKFTAQSISDLSKTQDSDKLNEPLDLITHEIGQIHTTTAQIYENGVAKLNVGNQATASQGVEESAHSSTMSSPIVCPSTSRDYYVKNMENSYISPSKMSCSSMSPIKLSRELKLAMKEGLARKRKSNLIARTLFKIDDKGSEVQTQHSQSSEETCSPPEQPENSQDGAETTSRPSKMKKKEDSQSTPSQFDESGVDH